MWCMHSIFSVKSDFLGSTATTCVDMLWSSMDGSSQVHKVNYTYGAKRRERKPSFQCEFNVSVVQDIPQMYTRTYCSLHFDHRCGWTWLNAWSVWIENTYCFGFKLVYLCTWKCDCRNKDRGVVFAFNHVQPQIASSWKSQPPVCAVRSIQRHSETRSSAHGDTARFRRVEK